MIDSCDFTSNQASDDGGAIYIKRRSTVEINKCHFKFNRAADSGGSVAVQTSDMVIESSVFENESVLSGYGGSVCVLDIGNVTIEHSTFLACRSHYKGGAISVMSESVLKIEHSTISESLANISAGGLYVNHMSHLVASDVSVQGSTSASGSGIYCSTSKMMLTSGNVTQNNASSNGGGVYLDNCEAMLDYIKFTENKALRHGGGIFATSSSLDIHNSLGRGNIAGHTGGFVMVTVMSKLTSKFLTLRDNKAAHTGGSIAVFKNSYATLDQVYFVDIRKKLCHVAVVRSSCLTIIARYHSNNSTNDSYNLNDSVTPNGTSSREGVCVDSSSLLSGSPSSGMKIATVLVGQVIFSVMSIDKITFEHN